MTESVSESTNLSLSALYDLKAYFGEKNIKVKDENEESEEQKKRANSATTRKVLKELQANMDTEKNRDALKIKYDNEKSPFLSEEYTSAERKSPFMTFDSERPNVFFSAEQLNTNTPKEPLAIQRPENYADSGINTSLTLGKNKDSIITELRRSAMSSSMTARDIANKYHISYMQAQEIFVALNEDKNGIVREFNIPQNSTVSFLV